MSTRGNVVSDPGAVSHWLKQLYPDNANPLVRRPPLERSCEVDVCIVGAGYTGLWTAYELRRADPSLNVILLDAEFAGYGASGRNGGAVIAQVNGSREYWTKRAGREGLLNLESAVRDAVREIGDVVAREGIDCGYSRNGVVMVARSELEADRLRRTVAEDHATGLVEEDVRFLSADEAVERLKVEGTHGARFSSHCASIDPGVLVRGLAESVERLGATIFEGTRVKSIEPGVVRTESGLEVRAKTILRATEAFTQSLKTDRNVMVPVFTAMYVTEVLDEKAWANIGWKGREALLTEHPFMHLQHTRDGRITIGGDDPRIPYRYGSAPCPDRPASARIEAHYIAELTKLFPSLSGVRFDHKWQGMLSAPRNWAPGVGLDRETGLAWAGGYVGEGVAMSNLAGRTVADLVLGRDTELTRLPFVGLSGRRWEPEPLRWLGAVGIGGMRHIGDASERRTGKRSRIWALADRLAGFTGNIG